MPSSLGFPIHYSGHLHDDLSLRALYSAADALAVPSRQEALGQTASEAHACATPVIAFNTGGLPDIVAHQRTGYLAKAFETDDLARGIAWALAQRASRRWSGLRRRWWLSSIGRCMARLFPQPNRHKLQLMMSHTSWGCHVSEF